MIKNPSIILASQSPRRQQLLREAGFEFEVIVSHVEEVELDSAKETVIANALLKATEVADKYSDKIVIGA
ncbi:MAG: Maf family protein, partial [Lentisphaeraceae bacterium]|nr:Maf family protein [Lentisphaeraceae bacterium]